MDALRTLEILITSRTPLIAIETLEEERVEQALERVAQRLRIPLFVWTMTRGLRRAGALDPLYDTKEPIKALRNLADLPNEGIYLMKDLYRSLGDAAVVRTLQDMAHTFSRDRRAMVLTAPRVELPSELAVLASLVKLELPTEDDLRALAQEVFGHLARQNRLGPPPAPDILDKIAAALRGLTLFEAERALTRAALDDLTLGPRDIEVIAGMKKEFTALPPELMRKGRFDEIFFIDLPAADERRQIFAIHLARRHCDAAGFDLPALAAAAEGFSGAEIEQAVVAALYTTFARGAQLSTEHILEEIKATKPLSVTRAEEVQDLREWAGGRAVPAS